MGVRGMMEQLILNIAMFVPYGLLLPMAFKKPRKMPMQILVVFLTTFSIETLQYFMGRSADVDDIIMNCLGGLLGYLCFKIGNRAFAKKPWGQKAIGS